MSTEFRVIKHLPFPESMGTVTTAFDTTAEDMLTMHYQLQSYEEEGYCEYSQTEPAEFITAFASFVEANNVDVRYLETADGQELHFQDMDAEGLECAADDYVRYVLPDFFNQLIPPHVTDVIFTVSSYYDGCYGFYTDMGDET